jgi:hypothetical protein
MEKKIEFTPFLAVAYAEGFCEGENATIVERIEAFAYIAKHNLQSTLQGFFGRTIAELKNRGLITEDNEPNYEKIDELLND